MLAVKFKKVVFTIKACRYCSKVKCSIPVGCNHANVNCCHTIFQLISSLCNKVWSLAPACMPTCLSATSWNRSFHVWTTHGSVWGWSGLLQIQKKQTRKENIWQPRQLLKLICKYLICSWWKKNMDKELGIIIYTTRNQAWGDIHAPSPEQMPIEWLVRGGRNKLFSTNLQPILDLVHKSQAMMGTCQHLQASAVCLTPSTLRQWKGTNLTAHSRQSLFCLVE